MIRFWLVVLSVVGMAGAAFAQVTDGGRPDVLVVGGESAVSAGVLAEIDGLTAGRVERVSGAGRYETAAALATAAFEPAVPVVYLATGSVFPDALVAGPGASRDGGPVLLVRPSGPVPDATRAALTELEPERVVVVGGTAAIAASVRDEVEAITGVEVERIAGATRYDTAVALSAAHHDPGVARVVVATGLNFPDALAAVPAAARWDAPILLTATHQIPAVVEAELARLQPGRITVVGGPRAVGQGLEDLLAEHTSGPVDRVWGPTREATAAAISRAAFPDGAELAFVATGADFADALALGPVAGAASGAAQFAALALAPNDGGGPILLTRGQRLAPDAAGEIARLAGENRPPVAQDQAVTTAFETPMEITLEASDPDGDPLTYDITDGPGHGTVAGDGADVTYTPDAGFHGTDTFTFVASDGVALSNVATVTITVEPPPPVARDVAVSTDQQAAVVVTLDADNHSGNPLTYHYDQPANGEVAGDGPEVTYTPDAGFHGTDTFDYRANDGFNDSNTATVTVSVESLPPVAHDASVETLENTPVAITLTGTSPAGLPLTFAVEDEPDDGTLSGTAPNLTYTPDAAFLGSDAFTFRVNDGFNDSNVATVTVTVEPAPPTAADVSASTDQDTPVVVTLDAASPSGQVLTHHYDQPTDGTVTGAGPDVTYTPDPGFFGTDTFTYHVNDGFNDSNTATVTVTVNFTAEDHAFDALGNTLLEAGVTASGDPAVRVDDTLLDGAEPGFTVSDVDDSGAAGSVDWDADGSFSYAPAVGFTGDDTFTYTISDGTVSGSGTVTVTVDELIWYVDDAASGDGRSWSPLGSLAAAETASGPDDVIFVYEGAAAYPDGIALQAGQRLIGEGAGLTVDGHELVDVGDRPSINPAAGDAVTLAGGAEVRGVDVTGAPGRGLVASALTGTVTVADASVAGTTGHAVHVSGGSATIAVGADVTNASGHAVRVEDASGGAVTFSGTITETGAGIALTGNTGATIAFTGLLDVTTTSDTAFAATGGGTVTATAAGSGLTATNARGLHVANTTIGAAGLRFASVASSDTVHGIELSATGVGPLVVDGDGSANRNGTGGTITGMSSHGVTLANTGPVTLRNMTVEDNDAVGIRAQSASGLTLVAADVTGNTNDQANPATRNSVYLRNVTGTVRIEDSFVSGSVHNQVDMENDTGTVTVDVLRTELRDNDTNSGFQLEAVGTATVTLNVDESTFADHHATGLHAFARNSATLTVAIDDNTFEGNNVAVNLAAQHTATMFSTVTNNDTSGHPSHSINATVHDDAVHDVTAAGNDVDTEDTVASVGIRLVVENDAKMRALVENNTVEGQTSGNGFRALAREDAGELHLVLRDNHMVTTSTSAVYSIEPIHESFLCAAASGNTGGSNHPSRDLFVDLFDGGASGQFEGAAPGPLTEAELNDHLAAANPPLRSGSFVNGNATGVAVDTCERPS